MLNSHNANTPVHPASLAKLMTLYITFQELRDGRLKLDEELPVSEHAASQQPTKLWLRPGSKISVRSAILGITTRSANDAAVVLAEAIGGTESNFARRMTATAHFLGMTHTRFRNATGLPNPPDWTTAHDMARLAMALIHGYPQYYHFFGVRSFRFRGHTIYSFDHVLTEYRGADGLKTGYIRASGFNLVTSAVRNHHRLVGVVFGGRTARSRDRLMMVLLNRGFASKQLTALSAHATPIPPPAPAAKRHSKESVRLVSDTHGGYAGNAENHNCVIQIGGGFRSERSVRRVLHSAERSAPGLLSPRKELVVRINSRGYLARFWRMSGDRALRACRALRDKGFTCTVVRGPAPEDLARVSSPQRAETD